MDRRHYSPPWADTSIIGLAGSSGSGKTSLAVEIVKSLNLPWVVIMSMVEFHLFSLGSTANQTKDSFYKVLTPEQHALARW